MRQRWMMGAATVFLAFSTLATDYYVNPNQPNDGGDGLTRETAKKTLAAVALIAVNPDDVIHAAPGDYNDNANNTYRVDVKAGVTLMSDYGAEVTFITGADSPTPNRDGCGPGAIRCVHLSANAKLVGFTLRGGRSNDNGSSSTAAYRGGGVHAADGTLVSDCVFTNNIAVRGGAQYGVTYSLRNRYLNNKAVSNVSGAGYSGSYWNCIFRGNAASYDLHTSGSIVNCTFLAPGGGKAGNDSASLVRNCLFLSQPSKSSCTFENCYFSALPPESSYTTNGTCRLVPPSSSSLRLNADFSPMRGHNVGINAGDLALYLDGYPESDPGSSANDAYRNDRVMEGALDIGAVESADKGVLSSALQPVLVQAGLSPRARVMQASNDVAVVDGRVRIPAGAALELVWRQVATSTVTRAFVAAATGGATLAVTRDNAAEPAWTFDAAVGATNVMYQTHPVERLRFACTGEEGDYADISDFHDAAFFVVLDADGALAVTGLEGSAAVLSSGEPIDVAISRTYTTPKLCLGFRVNGEFVSFDDHDDGWAWTFQKASMTFDDRYVVEAVYATVNDWYVDAVNGNDANDGFRPGAAHAFRTLMRAMTNAFLAAGDVVHAAPGVYDEGEKAGAPSTQTNRVVVPANVTLVADGGPSVTVIEGRASTDETAIRGSGPGAIRCVALGGAGAKLIGFTLRNGHTDHDPSNNNKYLGGGVCGTSSTLVSDCVITNCVAQRGGGVSHCTLVTRCRIVDCNATYLAGGANAGSALYNCIFDGNGGSYDVYSTPRIVNCTFGSRSTAGPRSSTESEESMLVAQNCIFLCSLREGVRYKNCRYTQTYTVGKPAVFEETTRKVSSAALDLVDYAPASTNSVAVDAGDDVGYFADYNSTLDADGILLDAARGQRVYNGRIDIGAREYDWRGLYARAIGRQANVTAAETNVVLAAEGVRVPDGSSLELAWTSGDKESALGFSVDGAGAASVAVDGAAVPGSPFAAGAHRVVMSAAEGLRTARLSFAGEGAALVKALRLLRGAFLFVR